VDGRGLKGEEPRKHQSGRTSFIRAPSCEIRQIVDLGHKNLTKGTEGRKNPQVVAVDLWPLGRTPHVKLRETFFGRQRGSGLGALALGNKTFTYPRCKKNEKKKKLPIQPAHPFIIVRRSVAYGEKSSCSVAYKDGFVSGLSESRGRWTRETQKKKRSKFMLLKTIPVLKEKKKDYLGKGCSRKHPPLRQVKRRRSSIS